MRVTVLAAQMQIIGTGDKVVFDAGKKPNSKSKRGSFVKKMTLKKSKSQGAPAFDPILAQLPKSRTLKRQTAEPLSKKNLNRQKEVADASIGLFTEVVQCYENYKSLLNTAQKEGSKLEPRYPDILEEMQDEIMVSNLVLTGLCSPE